MKHLLLKSCAIGMLICICACKTKVPKAPEVIGYALKSPGFEVFPEDEKPDLHAFLLNQTTQVFTSRKHALLRASVNPDSLKVRQQLLTEWFEPQITSSFPTQKCALSPQVTGEIVLKEAGYRIEKILYQSRENHHVSANLYLPLEREGPIPGVLMTCGHSNIGKAAGVYQAMCILLARNGIACLIVDPIGQGERFQFLDESGQPATRGGTLTHSLMDYAANLTGTDVASLMAWDNIRGIDYLMSRPEVDPTRIGVTGNSGGGTQTAFLMAYDKRITVAVPSCYITAHEGLIGGIGPQDGCQQLYGEATVEFDHGDFLNMVAPKPIRILSAEQDFFPIDYTRSTYAEVQQTYRTLDAEEKVSLFTYNDKHGFSNPRRQAGVQWFRQWFFGDSSPVVEPEWEALSDTALWACPTGQVLSHLPAERNVVDLLVEREEAFAISRTEFQENMHPLLIRDKIIEVLSIPLQVPNFITKFGVAEQHLGFTLTRTQIQPHDGFPIPGLWYEPDGYSGTGPIHLIVAGQGKSASVQPGDMILNLLRQGQPVFTMDLRSIGESLDDPEKNTYVDGTQSDYRNGMISWFLGKPLLGQRVQEIRVAAKALRDWTDSPIGAVQVHATGRAGIAALHAAYFDRHIPIVNLENCPKSWMEFVNNPLQQHVLSQIAPNALNWYDLIDLERFIMPRKVVWRGEFKGEEL